MDPLIPLLRRTSAVPKDDFLVYDQRYELDYYDPIPIHVETKETNEELYGDKTIYEELLEARIQYGIMTNPSHARLLANPFESISCSALYRGKDEPPKDGMGFLNRAATKMASIIKAFPELMPNDPIIRISMLAEAPGAMLEYLMWHAYNTNRTTEVTAISLEDNIGWAIDRSRMPGVDMNRITILMGKDNSGNLLIPANIDSFVEKTLLLGQRDLVVADGGVDVDETPEKQESMNAPLILAEALCALRVLREGGCFVLKIYDAYDRFTADILQLLCRHFRLSTIFKPLTSRPANAERYFIGRGFTGLHMNTKTIKDLDIILTNVANSGFKSGKVASFLPRAPQIIVDFIARLNNWHSKRQVSFLRWAVYVDDQLTTNPLSKPNYPISYDLSRYYDLVGVPCVRTKIYFELNSSPCQEIKLLDKVAQLARDVSARNPEVNLLPTLFGWFRYQLAIGAKDVFSWDENTLESWCDSRGLSDQEAKNRELLLNALSTDIELKEEPCPTLKFQLEEAGEIRVIKGRTTDGGEYNTIEVNRTTLTNFLISKEREYKNKQQQIEYAEQPRLLERNFVFLKRYEAYRLDEDAYKVTYPSAIDVDLYATLLTHVSNSFYSPLWELEGPFGAIGPPISDIDPPEGSILALNLLYINEPKLRELLIKRAFDLVSKDNKYTLYIATFVNYPVLDKSKYKQGSATILESGSVKNAITGKIVDKRTLLYRFTSDEMKSVQAPKSIIKTSTDTTKKVVKFNTGKTKLTK